MTAKPPLTTAPVIVTGSRGRLASHLADALSAAGVEVVRVSRSPGRGHVSYAELEKSGLIRKAAALIHCAWSSVPATAEEQPDSAQQHDLPLLRRLLNEVAKRPDPRSLQFVFLSSGGAIYGECETAASETTPPAPVGWYGRGKVAAEEMLGTLPAASSPAICILRPSNPYGFRFAADRPQGIIGAALDAVRTGRPLNLLGGGSALKDFLHVDDFEAAVMDCLRCRLSGVYNVCSGHSVRTSDVILLLEELGGMKVPRVDVPDVPWDVHRSVLSREKLSAATGWEPSYGLREGLLKVLRDAGWSAIG